MADLQAELARFEAELAGATGLVMSTSYSRLRLICLTQSAHSKVFCRLKCFIGMISSTERIVCLGQ